jgi:dipeptidyl aminopeptidase/acylaminoacyl peptidase
MLIRLIAALALTGVLAQPAAAQTIPAARFAAAPTTLSAALSPSGEYVALRQQQGDTQSIAIITLATRRMLIAQQANVDQAVFDWVAWKGDDRLLLSATVRLNVSRVMASRVVSMNREGEDVVMMFEHQMSRLGYGYGSTFLSDALPNDPNNVLLTAWDNGGAGVWRANIRTGRVQQDDASLPRALRYYTDGAGEAVLRVDLDWNADSLKVYRRASGVRGWTFAFNTRRASMSSAAPDFEVVGPGPGANQVYVLARPPERDLAALYIYDTSTGSLGEPIQEAARTEVSAPWVNPRTRAIIAMCEHGQRLTCSAREPTIERGLEALRTRFGPDLNIELVEASASGARWLVLIEGPTQPGAYFVYEPDGGALFPIARRYQEIAESALSPTTSVAYRGRDGTELWTYVTARSGVEGPRPMVVMPHGGPEARDVYGYDDYVQFLASRGYVVLQPNFRGSHGSGRIFADAGRGQWGLRMQDDVTDAVRHMIEVGVADPNRICIIGASYGGYAALAGVALTPELYRCAISIAGVSDLAEALRDERREGFGSVSYQYWVRSIGDPRLNAEAIAAASPRQQASRITAPVLLMHGEDDPIVPIEQSEIMEEALRGSAHPARLIRFEDAAHPWIGWSTQDRVRVFEETERFLAQNLGP